MSTMDITSTTHSEFRSAAPANGNDLRIIETSEPAQSAEVVARSAPSVAELAALDEKTRAELGQDWADRCQREGAIARDLETRKDAYLLRAIATLALSVVFFPDTDWAEKVDALRIGSANVKSKYRLAMAVVAAFRLNPYQTDKTKAKLDSLALGRNALATEWLALYIAGLEPDEKAELTLDEAGVDKLSKVLHDKGGVIAVGDLQRAANREAVAASLLRVSIDKKGAASIIAERGEQRLRAQNGITDKAPVPFVVDVKVGDAKKAYPIPTELFEAIKASVFQAVAGIDPLIDTFGELMKVSAIVPHTPAGAAAGTDPEMSAGSRQFVLRADQSVQISSIPANNAVNPVLIARPVAKVIETWPTSSCRMSRQGWQFAEANLIDTDRRAYFKASVSAVPGSTATITLGTVTTGDNFSSQAIELEPLVAGMSAYPVEFDVSSFQTDFEFEVDMSNLKDWYGKAASKLRDSGSVVKLVANGIKTTVASGKHAIEVSLTGRAQEGEVYLRGTDFDSLAKALAGLGLASNAKVSFAIDPKAGMRIRFGTSLATYDLYAPVLQPGSYKPVAQSFRPMAVA